MEITISPLGDKVKTAKKPAQYNVLKLGRVLVIMPLIIVSYGSWFLESCVETEA